MKKEYMIPKIEVTPLFSANVLCGSFNTPGLFDELSPEMW